MTFYVLVFIFSVFISAVSQILLKISAKNKYDSAIKEYLNPKVIFAYGLFFGSLLLTILAYKGVPLSLGPVLEATGYIWVTILGHIVLKENVNIRKIMGIIIIILGIVISTL